MSEHIWGWHSVLEALRANGSVKRLLVAATGRWQPRMAEVFRLAQASGVPVRQVSVAALNAISPHHQGIVAEVRPFAYATFAEILEAVATAPRPPLLLALDSIQDPQNLGTLLRTAEAAGVQGVLLPVHRAAAVTPAVVGASAGAVAHLRIARVTNLPRALAQLKEAGLWVYGVDVKGTVLYSAQDLTGPTALVIGGEGQGLGRLVRASCDALLRLPMYGRVESLNAAIAGAIVLYEALRQRGY